LRQIECTNIEGVIGYFHHPDFSIKIYACNFELSFFNCIAKLWIKTVVANKLLSYFISTVSLIDKRV
jgi:hypothetical protein